VSGTEFQVPGAQGDIATTGETQAMVGSKEEGVTTSTRVSDRNRLHAPSHRAPETWHLILPFHKLIDEFNDLAYESINELLALF